MHLDDAASATVAILRREKGYRNLFMQIESTREAWSGVCKGAVLAPLQNCDRQVIPARGETMDRIRYLVRPKAGTSDRLLRVGLVSVARRIATGRIATERKSRSGRAGFRNRDTLRAGGASISTTRPAAGWSLQCRGNLPPLAERGSAARQLSESSSLR
jgi:hypothetical protein